MEEARNKKSLVHLIQHGLMNRMKVWCSVLISMILDICALGVNVTILVIKGTLFLCYLFYIVERTDIRRERLPPTT